MPRPHFSESPDYQRYLQELKASTHKDATRRVDGIVGTILRDGYTLDESEVPVPATKKLASLTGQQNGMFREGHRSQAVAETRALSMLRVQAERDAFVESQFIGELVSAVQTFIDDQWHRANLRWTAAHDREPGQESPRPSFNELADAVLARLGYVRAEAPEVTRTRKAS